jgi:hypothetical protein
MRRAESEKLGAKANARDHSELGLSRIRNADAIASFDDFEGDD